MGGKCQTLYEYNRINHTYAAIIGFSAALLGCEIANGEVIKSTGQQGLNTRQASFDVPDAGGRGSTCSHGEKNDLLARNTLSMK